MKCKYYKSSMNRLYQYCKCLYNLKGCSSGGLLHILLDDDNYDDESILYCLKECLVHPEREESEIGVLICNEYLKMTMEERCVFDWLWIGNPLECESISDNRCKSCKLFGEHYDYMNG